MIRLNHNEHLALDRAQWRKIIDVANPNLLGQRLGLVTGIYVVSSMLSLVFTNQETFVILTKTNNLICHLIG